MKITCKFCDRYMFTVSSTTIIEGIICQNSKCKAKQNIKIIFSDDATEQQLRYNPELPEQPPKSF